MLIHGGDGRILKVHYKGQRGEGVYDLNWEGLIKNVERRYRETGSDTMKQEYEQFMRITPCAACHGQRLKQSSLAVTVADKNIYEMTDMSVKDLVKYLAEMQLTEQQQFIGNQILKEIRARVGFLQEVGLDYLTLTRATGTLSGGEAQRIRLATQIGSGLVGVAYILDEPSIGLHQRDNDKLLHALMNLKNLGNTLIVVEHDEDTMRAADYIVDIGPAAGVHGGEVVAAGTAADIMKCKKSITGAYLSGRMKIPVPSERRRPTGFLTIKGARENNLKNIDVQVPLGIMTCITGVSGSGKSSLTNEILYKHLARTLNRARCIPGDHDDILGVEQLDKIIDIDQSPIGRTPRSNPATYTGVFDMIRDLFAATPDAKARGYKKGRFSFNVKGGRCEACSGDGILKIEMHFLPDVYVPCEVCGGKRYNRETLDVKYKGKSIFDVLDMTVEEALPFFENVPFIRRKIETLYDVGLSYVKLGQPSTTLSGGEAQRIRLATQIGSSLMGVLYILDEPSIGLHQRDNARLIEALKNLRDLGNTVIVVEHDEETMEAADYIVDIGPGAGIHGGHVVYSGPANEIKYCKESITGQYLSGAKKIPLPESRRPGNGGYLEIVGAAENNLKNINVKFPLGCFVAVTGVSGSGKSSLVNEILNKALSKELMGAHVRPGKYKTLHGLELVDKVIDIDQSPIGRTPRSNPATYTGVFNDIREVFASTNEAKMRGYKIGRFSFNVKGGRCEACEGAGILEIPMHFLPDVYVPCEVCKGKRYNRETLEVKYKGKSIYDVLEMSVEEGLTFFENLPKIKRKLQTLYDVGLGYIKIGQPATTLSGGEAQRIKIARYACDDRVIEIINLPNSYALRDEWKNLKSFTRMTSAKNKKKECIRYFISNTQDHRLIIDGIEQRWSIENEYHKPKDIDLHEDGWKTTSKNALKNIATLNNLALLIIHMYAAISGKIFRKAKVYVQNNPHDSINFILGTMSSQEITDKIIRELDKR